MAQGFAASVGAWAAETEERTQAVFRQSVQALVEEARKPRTRGGRLPILKGHLWRSFMTSTIAMPSVTDQSEFLTDPTGAINVTIAGAQLGQTIFIGVQAAHGPRMEYGFVGTDSLGRAYNQQGFGFMSAAAQRWPLIVAEQERLIQSSVTGR